MSLFDSNVHILPTGDQLIFEMPAGMQGVIALDFENVTAAGSDLTIKVYKNVNTLTKTIRNARALAAKTNIPTPLKIGLQGGDKVYASSSVASAIVAVVSYSIATGTTFMTSQNPRGPWTNVMAVLKGDVVGNANKNWWALQPSTNVTPVEGAFWTELKYGERASAADLMAGTDDVKIMTAKGFAEAYDPRVLTGVADSTVLNLSGGADPRASWRLELTSSFTLANPTGKVNGQNGFIFIKQGSGGQTITVGTGIRKPSGLIITLSTGAGKVDALAYTIEGGVMVITGFVKDIVLL